MENRTVQLSENAKKILARWQTMPQEALAGIARSMQKENELTIGRITRDYLSFPKQGPPVPIGLRVQSGLLRRSIRASVPTVSGSEVRSSIGSNVVYAAIHEFGGRTSPHRIQSKTGGALRFFSQGKPVFCKWVNHPGSNMPERGYTRRGIADRIENYGNAASKAVISAMAGK